MKVYKYYSSQFDFSMKAGFIYLNTFENIRAYDNSGLIGDSDEASSTHKVNLSYKNPSKSEMNYIEHAMSGAIKFGPDASVDSFIIEDSTVKNNLPDAFMFCVTYEKNDIFWKKTSSYDKSLSIPNFSQYASRVSAALNRQGILHSYAVGKCEYDLQQGYVDNLGYKLFSPDYFRKTNKHQNQKEIRAVFLPFYGLHKIKPKTLFIGIQGLKF